MDVKKTIYKDGTKTLQVLRMCNKQLICAGNVPLHIERPNLNGIEFVVGI